MLAAMLAAEVFGLGAVDDLSDAEAAVLGPVVVEQPAREDPTSKAATQVARERFIDSAPGLMVQPTASVAWVNKALIQKEIHKNGPRSQAFPASTSALAAWPQSRIAGSAIMRSM